MCAQSALGAAMEEFGFGEDIMSQTLFIPNQVNNNSSGDYISQLPDDMLEFILSFMSMRDAVKARILSPRWRNLSAPMSDLNFDLLTMFDISYERMESSRNSQTCQNNKCRFIAGVNQFLQLHRGVAKIRSFRVRFCFGNESACHLDRWISFAVTMGTEKLELNFSAYPKNTELYNFPFHLLPRSSASPLKHLCLESCILRPCPNSTDRLKSLITVDLIDITFDQSCLKSVFTGCVNLEWFRLECCTLPLTLFISNQFLRLKTLIVQNCIGAENIVLSSDSLTTFEYFGKVISFRFLGVPLLEKVYFKFLDAYERGTNFMFKELPNNHPRLQILTLHLMSSKLRPIPARITRFNNLKKLELIIYVWKNFDLLSITSIINASPLLEKFHLALHYGGDRGPSRAAEYLSQPHLQLKEIEISGFSDRWNAMALAKYLLNYSVALEKLIVSSYREIYRGCNRWSSQPPSRPMDDSERERVHNLLLKEKVNPRAEVYVR